MNSKFFAFMCIVSVALFNSVEAMKRKRDEDYSYECSLEIGGKKCHYETCRPHILEEHETRHNLKNVEELWCAKCGFIAKSKHYLSAHEARMHSEKKVAKIEKRRASENQQCMYCKVSGRNISYHYERFHHNPWLPARKRYPHRISH